MPSEKCLVAPHLIDSGRLAPRHQRFQLIHKPERRTMRQGLQGLVKIRIHLRKNIALGNDPLLGKTPALVWKSELRGGQGVSETLFLLRIVNGLACPTLCLARGFIGLMGQSLERCGLIRQEGWQVQARHADAVVRHAVVNVEAVG